LYIIIVYNNNKILFVIIVYYNNNKILFVIIVYYNNKILFCNNKLCFKLTC